MKLTKFKQPTDPKREFKQHAAHPEKLFCGCPNNVVSSNPFTCRHGFAHIIKTLV